ncbi:MAG: hypothetical protein ACOZB0_08130 [Pseudomonadota bacterium]
METMKLTLTGHDEAGVEVYRSYFLVTDGGSMAGRGRASVIPMTGAAPMPDTDHVEVREGGEEHAIAELVERLTALPGNRGLVAQLSTPT